MIGKVVKYVDALGQPVSALVVKDNGTSLDLALVVFETISDSNDVKVSLVPATNVLPYKQEEREKDCWIAAA